MVNNLYGSVKAFPSLQHAVLCYRIVQPEAYHLELGDMLLVQRIYCTYFVKPSWCFSIFFFCYQENLHRCRNFKAKASNIRVNKLRANFIYYLEGTDRLRRLHF